MSFIPEASFQLAVSKTSLQQLPTIKSISSLKKRVSRASKAIEKYQKTLHARSVQFAKGEDTAENVNGVVTELLRAMEINKTNLLEYQRTLAFLPKDSSAKGLKSRIAKLRYNLDVLDRKAQALIKASNNNCLELVYVTKKEVTECVDRAKAKPQIAGLEVLFGVKKLNHATTEVSRKVQPDSGGRTLILEITKMQQRLASVSDGPLRLGKTARETKKKIQKKKVRNRSGKETKKQVERLLATEIASLMFERSDVTRDSQREDLNKLLETLRASAPAFFNELVSKEPFADFIKQGKIVELSGMLVGENSKTVDVVQLPSSVNQIKISHSEKEGRVFRVGLLKPSPSKPVKKLAQAVDQAALNCLRLGKYLDGQSLGLVSGEVNPTELFKEMELLGQTIENEKMSLNRMETELAKLGTATGGSKLQNLIVQHTNFIDTLEKKFQHLKLMCNNRYWRATIHRNGVELNITTALKDKNEKGAGSAIFKAWKGAEALQGVRDEIINQKVDTELLDEVKQLDAVVQARLNSKSVVKKLALSSGAGRLMKGLLRARTSFNIKDLKGRKHLVEDFQEILTKELIIALFYTQGPDQESRFAAIESLLEKAEALGIKDAVMQNTELKELMNRAEDFSCYRLKGAGGVPYFREGIKHGNQFFRLIENALIFPEEAGVYIAEAYQVYRDLTALRKEFPGNAVIDQLYVNVKTQIDELTPKTDKKGRPVIHPLLQWKTRKREKLLAQIMDRKIISEPKHSGRRFREILSKEHAMHLLTVDPDKECGMSKEVESMITNFNMTPTKGLTETICEEHEDLFELVARYEVEAYKKVEQRLSDSSEKDAVSQASAQFGKLPPMLQSRYREGFTSAVPVGEPKAPDEKVKQQRDHVIGEMASTEATFLEQMNNLLDPIYPIKGKKSKKGDVFDSLYSHGAISKKDYQFCVKTISEIQKVSQKLHTILSTGISTGAPYTGVFNAFDPDELDAYIRAIQAYASKYGEVSQRLMAAGRKNKGASVVFEEFSKNNGTKTLEQVIINPVQRLGRLMLLNRDLSKTHDSNDPVSIRLADISNRLGVGLDAVNASIGT